MTMRPLPLMGSNLDVVEPNTDNDFLTQKYTAAAVDYIKANKDQPFFLYLAHNVPHQPLGASPAFKGKSELGIYADAVEEMDWGVGQIMQKRFTIRESPTKLSPYLLATTAPGFKAAPGVCVEGKQKPTKAACASPLLRTCRAPSRREPRRQALAR